NWTQGPFNVQLIWQFIDEVGQDAIALDGAPASDYAVPKISAQHYFNLAGAWSVSDNWTLRLGIDNLFDNDPPITGNDYGGTAENSGNTFPATYTPLGRNYFFAVNSRW
ncbi:MAG: TonB-dependent receptor, partial [Gammaproteobacteria bacterium]|nr:TonB-dependent receptor [Gammaproteobacteria bacterium]